ncbi:sterility protein Ste20 [Histoplasma capsulatum var. duboisii H88]|uniref:Sterility protein Ste20 n=2 Tax=Ajellomyces capsulatus (strain H88) TaxID=544711 RepID=F0URN1_AJEC8|nr:sterility protein Ste20 [Histoplasma capsulatum var. duboisii H88]
MASNYDPASSATPTQRRVLSDGNPFSSQEDASTDGSWHDAASKSSGNRIGSNPAPTATSSNSCSCSSSNNNNSNNINNTNNFGPWSASFAPSGPPPGSFSSDLKSISSTRGPTTSTPRPEPPFPSRIIAIDGVDVLARAEQRQAVLRGKIAKELKIKSGTENMLEALLVKNLKQTKEQRLRVESELSSSNMKLAQLRHELEEEILRAQAQTSPTAGRLSTLFRGTPMRSPSRASQGGDVGMGSGDAETESPTYVLAETLQELETTDMPSDYYVERANNLVDLFKRHPTLKYDLAWQVFGLRVQTMLLSDSRDVVAAGYRLTRHAIADRRSIQIIRSFHTDEMVMMSLVKETKPTIEREQALKFVRAFLDVKDGVRELSRGVVRTLVSIADHRDDRLRNICIMTLAEILVKDPGLLFFAGGIGVLNDALGEGVYGASESLAAGFIHILDTPRNRIYLRAGCELEGVFATFTDPLGDSNHHARLKSSAKTISSMLKTWPGLLTLLRNKAKPLQSLLNSLQYPEPLARDLILELLFDALRIKPPSWSSSFLAGRRLTTYGRVTNLRSESDTKHLRAFDEHENNSFDLTTHFSALVLAVLIEAGLIAALSNLIEDEPDLSLKRKGTLLLTEVLKLAHHSLPQSMSAKLQVLPQLLPCSTPRDTETYHVSTSTVYQMESINRTLTRSDGMQSSRGKYTVHTDISASLLTTEQGKTKLSASMDEGQFRTAVLDTHVLSSVNFTKWKWDLIHNIIEGPLTNPKRLDEAIRGSKFMKRLMGFYRPFKSRFSMIRNTKPNQRYVRTGCALMRTLLQTPEGTKYLAENKLLRQIAECLAQVDRMSGLTSSSPVFSRNNMSETLSGGYFALLGVLSSEPSGLQMMERWHMHNMFYHIIELKDRNDLIQTLLGNMDFSLESHLRIILSKALTTGSKDIRIFATKLLRKYVVGSVSFPAPMVDIGNGEWVVKLLVTQLYDPEVAVCQVAVKILEEACNQRSCLEYVVKCRPSLDHLGEIGAPLLLRFLSTSVGYHYLDGLDYITQEMDDWFLGRNDAYVGLVEASLTRAYVDQPRRNSFAFDDIVEMQDIGLVPPHFYRELARTHEGCKLLEQSGHFNEFAHTIRDFRLDEEDPEVLLKVKGCLWAVGNVGSMDLSAPFLEETEIVGAIGKIAENAGVMTMRGTAFFVLGLISRSLHGMEMLLEAGWDAAVDQKGRSLGSCIPVQLSRLYSVSFPAYEPNIDEERAEKERFKAAATDSDPVCQKILDLVIDMGNTVLSKRAASDLNTLRTKKPEYFRQIPLFQKTLILLESHHFRLPARRFALDLFDRSVLRRIVRGDWDKDGDGANADIDAYADIDFDISIDGDGDIDGVPASNLQPDADTSMGN